jgi:hypothetical protein
MTFAAAASPTIEPRPTDLPTWRSQIDPNWAISRPGAPGLLLPIGEQALASSNRLVVSAVNAPPGPSYGGATIVVRALATGTVLRQISRPEAVDTAVVVGNVVFFSGQNRTRTDPGLLRLDVTTGLVTRVVPLRRWPADWPTPGTRNQILVSASGRTVGSPVCGGIFNRPPHCWVDLVDIRTGTVTRPARDIPDRPWLITDDTIFARRDYPQRLVAYDAKTGLRRWSIPGLVSSGYATRTGSTLVATHRRRAAPKYALSTHVLAIDTRTGRSRSLLSAGSSSPLPAVWAELSTDAVAVVGNVPLTDAFNGGVATAEARRIDVATGKLLVEPLTIKADFLKVAGIEPAPAPSSGPLAPYRLAGFPAPNTIRLIRTAADCAPLATVTARVSCELVLRSDWRAILTPVDPLPDSRTFRAAMSRAVLDGDLSLCDDVAMKTWLSQPTPSAAPPADLVRDTAGPVASCRAFLWTQETLGSLDPVQIDRRPGAAAPMPAADPAVACGWAVGEAPFPRESCTATANAVLSHYGYPSAVTLIHVLTGRGPCDSGIAICAVPPTDGTFLGTVVVGLSGNRHNVFDAWQVGSTVALLPVDPLPAALRQ